jgi:type I restriction enzyme S subunit
VQVPLGEVVRARSGDSTLIKGKLSDRRSDAFPFPAFSASGQDVWCPEAHHQGAGVVISAVGARCGKTFFARGAWTAIANTHVLLPEACLDPKFLWYLTNDERFWLRGGSAQPFVRVRQTLERRIPLPPLAEQRRIVAAIEEQASRLDHARTALEGSRSRLVRLRSALLGVLIEGWAERQLGEFSDVFVGATPRRSVPAFWNGNIPWVASGEVAFCRIGKTRESITEAAVTSPERVHPPGTLLIAMIGEGKTRGQAAILDVAAAHNQNSAAVRLDRTICEPEWLFYVLMARYEVTRRAGSGAQQPALNSARVRALRIPLPPLDEQRRLIAEVERGLSVLASVADDVGAAVDRGDGLRRSILARAFRGELVPQDPDDEPASVLLERIAAERAAAEKATGRRPRRRARMQT